MGKPRRPDPPISAIAVPARAWEPPRPWLILLGILLLATGLRLPHLGDSGPWTDELFSYELATGRGYWHGEVPADVLLTRPPALTGADVSLPWTRIWTSLSRDVHPPLYYIALRGWRGLFGETDAAARSLSVVASLAAILLLYVVGRRVSGTVPALLACLLMAISIEQMGYAQEARSYALLLPLGLLACLAIVKIRLDGPAWGWAIVLAAMVWAMSVTHYFSAGASAALGLYALVALRGRSRLCAVTALVVGGGIALLTWGPFLWQQTHSVAYAISDWSTEPREHHLINTLQRVLILPYRYLCEPHLTRRNAYADPLFYTALLSGVLFVLPFLRLRKRPGLLLWGLWACGVVGIVTAADLIRGGWQLDLVRYTLLASPAIYMIFAALFDDQRPLVRFALPGLAILACGLALPDAFFSSKEPFHQLTSDLTAKMQPGDAIVITAPQGPDWWSRVVYLGLSNGLRRFPGPVLILERPASAQVIESLRHAPHVWLLQAGRSFDPEQDKHRPQELLPGIVTTPVEFYPLIGHLSAVAWPAP